MFFARFISTFFSGSNCFDLALFAVFSALSISLFIPSKYSFIFGLVSVIL